MATAMLALDVSEEQEFSAQEEVAKWEDVQQASSLLREFLREELEAEIEQAKTTLIEHPIVDGEEGGYSSETLDRAVALLKMHIEWVWLSRGTKAPIPTIGPGPDGSVDLYWKQPSWKLLVNIPADKNALATFYGDNYGRQKSKGSLDPNELSIAIVAWLMA
jgi:hypothetical protein